MSRSVLLVAVLVGLGVPCTLCADTLRGVVHDENGKPISNARVDVATAAPKVGRGIFCPSCYLDCKKWTRTNDTGEFQIEGLDPKLKFRILSTFPGKQTRMTDLLDPAKDTPTVVLTDFPLDVPAERILTGRVVSKEGTPIPGALVEPYGAKTSEKRWWGTVEAQSVVSDDNGSFQMLLAADYQGVDITVTADGYAGTRRDLLSPGAEQHEIVVPPGTSVTGQLVSGDMPHAGARIAVVQTDRSASQHFIRSVLAVTDHEGRFEFHNLPASQQYAIFSPVAGRDTTSSEAEVRPILATKLFQCRADGDVRDLGKLELQPGLTLAGKIEMTDGSNLPEGLKLSLSRDPAWDLIEGTVSPDGQFSISGLAPETYEVIVNAKDIRIDSAAQRFQLVRPNSIGIRPKQSRDDIAIRLTPSNPVIPTAALEIKAESAESEKGTVPAEVPEVADTGRPSKRTLRPAAELTKEPSPEDGPKIRVRGTVVTSDGKPIESSAVMLRATSTGSRSDFLAKTTTDSNGRFTLSQVPLPLRMDNAITSLISGRGGASILVFAKGYGVGWMEVMSLDSETLKIVLKPEVEVRGTVRNEEGQPIPGARVKLVGIAGTDGVVDDLLRGANDLHLRTSEVDFSATVSDSGEFVLHHMPDTGRLFLSVDHPVHESTFALIDPTPRSRASTEVQKATIKTARRKEIALLHSPVSFELKRRPTISVRITDHTGAPIPTGSLRVIAKFDKDEWELLSTTTINASGPIRVPFRAPGRYLFTYTADFQTPMPGLQIEKNITSETENATIEMQIPESRWITGRVINAVTNQPIPGISIVCWEHQPEGTPKQYSGTVSETDGTFRLPTTSGKRRLSVTNGYYGYLRDEIGLPNQQRGEMIVDVPEDQNLSDVILKLSPGLRISGILVDSQGQPIPRTVVRADQIDQPFLSTAVRSDDQGRFELAGLSPKARTLVSAVSGATAARMILAPVPADNDESPMIEIQLSLNSHAQFTGRVLKNGQAVPRVKLEVTCSLPEENNRMMPFTVVSTDEQGRYTVGGLLPGDQYRFKIMTADGSMAPNWRYQSPYVQYVAADHQGIRELPDANLISTNQSLSGQVVDPDGNPLSGMSVSASLKNHGSIPRRDNAPPPWAETDVNGEFHLEQLPDNPIELMAYKRNPQGGRIHYPAQISADFNQKGIRIVLDPALTEPLKNLDP